MSLLDWWSTVRDELEASGEWRHAAPGGSQGVHLGVFVEPFLTFVIEGTKTVESRFSSTQRAPFHSVEPGDLLLVKAAGGPVVALAEIRRAWYLAHPKREQIRDLRSRYGRQLRDDVPGFWSSRSDAAFVSLFSLARVRALSRPIKCPKRDRRGWVVLSFRARQRSLFGDGTHRDRRGRGDRQRED